MKITNISWCTDENTIKELGLPTEEEFLSNLDIDVNSDVLNDIADYLSDKYGFLVESFFVEENDFIIDEKNDIYEYKGINISKGTWEDAPCPISCKDITIEGIKNILKLLYRDLVVTYGEDIIKEYINYINGIENNVEDIMLYENIDELRWKVEEQLFLDNGGIYYEDMTDEEYKKLIS